MQEGHGSAESMSAMQVGDGSGRAMAANQDGPRELARSEKDSVPHETTGKDGIGSVIQMGKAYKNRGQSALNGKRKKLKALTASEAGRDAAGNMLFGENLDPNVPQSEAPVAADLMDMLKKSIFGDGEDKSPQSLLEKAVDQAINQVCQRNPDIRPITLTKIARLGVFPIDSAALPGYLVLALDAAVAEDEKRFLKNCENALRGSFEAMGVAGKLEAGFWIDVPPVEFELWAQNAGTFNFKLPHLGQEIGVAYFQTEKPIAKSRPSSEKDMHAIGLADISTEEPVTFKAYLHLKQNNKFYLYLRNGRQLQPEQKQRLEANDVGEIFMKAVDVENFRVFLAAAYLKDTIRSASSEAA
jgi:hypothetical protein